MKTRPGTKPVMVWVTAPDLRTARRLAQAAVQERLAACAQIHRGIESHYWWQGKYECSREIMITFKTLQRRVRMLEQQVLASHPYDTPQFVVTPITGGSRRYLAWIAAETTPPKKSTGSQASPKRAAPQTHAGNP